MKLKLFPIWCIAMCLTIHPAKRASAEAMTASAIEADVWHVIEELNTAFARNDPAKYFSYIDPDINVITPSNPYRVEGIQDDREEFEYGLKRGTGRVGYFQEMQPKIQLFGDIAVVTYYSRGSYGAEEQEKVSYYKETDVLHKKDGKWKVVHVHVSATQ
jgi:ketosteroid isomerase-like protein